MRDKDAMEVLREHSENIIEEQYAGAEIIKEALNDGILAFRVCEKLRLELAREQKEKDAIFNMFNSTQTELQNALEDVEKWQKAYGVVKSQLCEVWAGRDKEGNPIE